MTQRGDVAQGGLRFEVLAEIAVGTTARIDLCRLASSGPHARALVAVKRLLPEIAADSSVASRFLDEVWMTAALRHPNVVGVVGWGNDEEGSFLACELVQGVSLARLVKTVIDTREEFPERLVVYIGASIARGLSAAHELVSDRGEPLNLVHRDLGPQNVLIGFNGDVKIGDFGLAHAKNRVTNTTSALPSRNIAHLSPEELRGEAVHQRADLYGLGAILFELLAGKAPFAGTDELDTIRNILGSPSPDPLRVRPKIDKSLAALVRQCLDKDPRGRPESAREIGGRLDGWLVAHGYRDDNAEALARFVRRNAMRQMRWFERVIAGRAAVETDTGRERTPNPPPPLDRGAERAPAFSGEARGAYTSSPSQGADPRRRDSRDTETTSVEQGKKVELPQKKARDSVATMAAVRPRRPERIEPHVPRISAAEADDEEGENVPTVAVRRSDVMKALAHKPAGSAASSPLAQTRPDRPPSARPTTPPPLPARKPSIAPPPLPQQPAASVAPQPPQAPLPPQPPPAPLPPQPPPPAPPPPMPPARGEPTPPPRSMPRIDVPRIYSEPDSVDLIPDDPSTDSPQHTAVLPLESMVDPVSLSSLSQGFADAPSRADLPRMSVPATPPVRPRPPAHSVESATMTLPNQLLAPEYIAHQVERLRGMALKKTLDAKHARDEANAAIAEAEEAEAEARRADTAVNMALEALHMAKAEQTSKAALRLEEALSLVDGPTING